jgi:hypothetical protein
VCAGHGVHLTRIGLQVPLCLLVAETSLGSNHTPLIFDSGDDISIRINRFFFRTGWFEREDFKERLLGFWQ